MKVNYLAALALVLALFAFVHPSNAQPHIDSLKIDEAKGQIELWGKFGIQNDVYVDYTPLTVISSSATSILCDIPDAGKGSCGLLVVYADGLSAAPRTITQWAMVLSKWFQHLYSDSGFDFQGDTTSLRFRFDFQEAVKMHRTGTFSIQAERSTYSHHVTGGHRGIRGGGLEFGIHDTINPGPFFVTINLWYQTVSVETDVPVPQCAFNPNFSVSTEDNGLNGRVRPLDGDSIAHFLPNDSTLWVSIFGATLFGNHFVAHLDELMPIKYQSDSLYRGSDYAAVFDTGSTQRPLDLTWNTSPSAHLIRSARTYTITDTLDSPFPHFETIKLLMADSNKKIDQVDMRYCSLLSDRSDTFDVRVSAVSIPLTVLAGNQVGLIDSASENQVENIGTSFRHSSYSYKGDPWLIMVDSVQTGSLGWPRMTIELHNAAEAVRWIPQQHMRPVAGYFLAEKLDSLRASGVRLIWDGLGREVDISRIANASEIRPGIYFAKLGDHFWKLLN